MANRKHIMHQQRTHSNSKFSGGGEFLTGKEAGQNNPILSENYFLVIYQLIQSIHNIYTYK